MGQRQIVMFELAGESYGIDLDIVREVIRMTGVSRVPQTPDFIEGVINLRGYVVPVLDLKKRFGIMGGSKEEQSARIMIVEIGEQILGVAVDKVMEVADIEEDAVEPPSALLRGAIKTDYLTGFVEINEALVKLLDFNRIISGTELKELDYFGDEEIEIPETEDRDSGA